MKSRKWVMFVSGLVCLLGLVAQAERVISTADGSGADTYVINDSRGSGNKGTATMMELRNFPDTRCRVLYLRFDISGVSSLTGAQLQLHIYEKGTGATTPWSVYGLLDDATDDFWGETTIKYDSYSDGISDAPGLLPATAGNYAVDASKMTLLGQFMYPGIFTGIATSDTTNLNLDSFLAADTNGVVTFLIIDETLSTKEFYISTKEREALDPAMFAPRLIIPDPTVEVVYPTAGQGDVELDVTLQWNGLVDAADENRLDPNVAAHNVYIDFDNTDSDPNLLYQGQVVVSDWSSRGAVWGPLALSLDDSVSWQIEEVMDFGSGNPGDPNNILGPVWSFTAIKSVPVVSQEMPVGVRVFPTEPVAFAVDFTSISAPTVTWYKDDNTTVTEITTGGGLIVNGGGSYTATLDLGASVDVADEGQYYCTVKNNSGPTEYTSGVANLVIKRQLAQYAFDGDLADSSANAAPAGTAMDSLGDPNTATHVAGTIHYVAGADGVGSALYLDANEYVHFGTDGYPKASPVTSNGFGGGLDEGTVVFWVQPTADVFQVLLANFNAADKNGFLTALQADQDFDLYIRDAANNNPANHPAGQPDRPEYNLTDGAWHMMAACWNGGSSKLYVDGQWVVDGTGAAPSVFAAWQYDMLLGAARAMANREFLTDMFAGGAIDDLRVYNYRLDDAGTDVFAQEYLDNTGIRPCTDMNYLDGLTNTNYDNTGSSYCVINLADFAVFAETWLVNGLY